MIDWLERQFSHNFRKWYVQYDVDLWGVRSRAIKKFWTRRGADNFVGVVKWDNQAVYAEVYRVP